MARCQARPAACIPSLQVGIKWTRLPVVVVRLLGERCCHDLVYGPGHADAMLCRLVARHCCVIVEAGERGLADVLGLEFQPAPYVLSTMLTCGKKVGQSLTNLIAKLGATEPDSVKAQRECPVAHR